MIPFVFGNEFLPVRCIDLLGTSCFRCRQASLAEYPRLSRACHKRSVIGALRTYINLLMIPRLGFTDTIATSVSQLVSIFCISSQRTFSNFLPNIPFGLLFQRLDVICQN